MQNFVNQFQRYLQTTMFRDPHLVMPNFVKRHFRTLGELIENFFTIFELITP